MAIADAYSQPGSPRARRSRPAVVALVVAIGAGVLLHGVGDYYVWAFYDAGNRIFVPDPSQNTADASPGPQAGRRHDRTERRQQVTCRPHRTRHGDPASRLIGDRASVLGGEVIAERVDE